MSSPPPPLEEQQQSFMRAQLMMATRVVPPLLSSRKLPPPPSQYPAEAFARPFASAISAATDASHAKTTKRTRQLSNTNKNNKSTRASALSWPLESAQPPPRKPAHVLQKEQRQAIIDEVHALEAHVERLRRLAGLPTKCDREEVVQAKAFSAELDENIHDNRRYAIQLKSEIMEELHFPPVNTLATYIHLPCDMDQRRMILQGMKDVKIRRAAEVGLARFEHLGHQTSFLSQERFTSEDGVYHCHRWEQIAFGNFETSRQLFDALFFFIYNMEISVTEMVNQVAVREDSEDIEPTIWNHRIVTTTKDIGCTEELNMVGFAHFFEHYEPLNGAPLGVIFVESVDEDDLYPYVPLERTRRVFQTIHLFCEVVDPETQHKTVVLRTCLLGSQLPPEFPLDPALLAKLQEYTPRWVALMNQYLRDFVVPP